MRQNICSGYFAFDRTQMVEMVMWLAQRRETRHDEARRGVRSLTLT